MPKHSNVKGCIEEWTDVEMDGLAKLGVAKDSAEGIDSLSPTIRALKEIVRNTDGKP